MRSSRAWSLLGALGVLLGLGGRAPAWHGRGHHVATTLAVGATRGKLPAFFADGAATVAHASLDPDLFTRPIGPEPLHSAEAPEHYFDVELLKGAKLPATRYEYLALCAKLGLKPDKVGLGPFSVTEWTQRLTVAFAEHRAYGDNPHVRSKCLLYAGILSHYAQDLCQPLHTTIHWDGRAKSDNSSPRSGIHRKVDALLGKLDVDRRAVLKDAAPAAFKDLRRAVLDEIARSNKLVDRVYELEQQLPELTAPLKQDSPVAAFTGERMRAAVRFTASLYVTAWRDSAKLKMPAWYARPYEPPPSPPPTVRKQSKGT